MSQKWLWAGLGLCALAALWKFEKHEDGPAVANAPLLLALAIEIGVLMARRREARLD